MFLVFGRILDYIFPDKLQQIEGANSDSTFEK